MLTRVAACLFLGVLSFSSFAQAYPSKPVRIIIGNAPGPANDLIARGISQVLGPRTGQAFIVENRPGADGAIGMEICAKAAPDGHTLCMAAQGALVLNQLLKIKIPYDPFRDFAPVVLLGYFDSGLVATASIPARSFQELIDLSKARPDSVSWAIFGFNSSGNMYAEWLKKSRGAPFFVVPYKTPPQMLQALLTGEVHVGVYALGALGQQIASGKLKVLAVTSEARYPSLPEVPTFSELGIKLPLRPWYGVVATAGTPRDVVRWLNAEVTRLATDAEFRSRFFTENGVTFSPNTPEEFGALMKNTHDEFAQLMRYIGIKPE
jgi:tripartite-type tricarboxylate transporter receptor subunit TctC